MHYLAYLHTKEPSEDGSDEGSDMSIQELFHVETDAFVARVDFDGSVSYNEVSLALWKKFKEAFNDLASNVDGLEPEVKWEPMDIISSFFARVEGEIDKICVSKDGKHEWERSGMIFLKNCVKMMSH